MKQLYAHDSLHYMVTQTDFKLYQQPLQHCSRWLGRYQCKLRRNYLIFSGFRRK